jgi:hypothetical protein
MAKIGTELKSIDTTGICKAKKEAPAKALKLGETFFASNLFMIYF